MKLTNTLYHRVTHPSRRCSYQLSEANYTLCSFVLWMIIHYVVLFRGWLYFMYMPITSTWAELGNMMDHKIHQILVCLGIAELSTPDADEPHMINTGADPRGSFPGGRWFCETPTTINAEPRGYGSVYRAAYLLKTKCEHAWMYF